MSAEYLDYPEDYLWVRQEDGLTALDRDRLNELKNGALPDSPIERVLVQNRVWLDIYLRHVIGNHVITINVSEPLPMWNSDIL